LGCTFIEWERGKKMESIQKLHQMGQSLWYDNIQRRTLENGEFARMIEHGDIRGVTSNPSIFNNAIARSTDYDAALKPMAWAGWDAERIFDQLVLEDIQAAADLFRPLYEETGGSDGYVSLEVNPFYADSTENTIAEARRLWEAANRPNVMIKIPATEAGIPAIAASIAAGINVNITLVFSRQRYAQVMDAYLQGLENRQADGLPIDRIASVASFFVSRVDTKVDPRLEEIIKREGPGASQALGLLGKAAIANAKLAYAMFLDFFGSQRFNRLQGLGAKVQRPLWASTSTKNPNYRDVIYIEELIGPRTVNTVPPQTLEAFRDHGAVSATLAAGLQDAEAALQQIEGLGISIDQVTHELEIEGVKAFSEAITALLKTVEERREAAVAELGPIRHGVTKTVNALEATRAVQRMHAADASLWTEDPAGAEEVKKRLGWLVLPWTSQDLVRQIDDLTTEVRGAGFTHALLLGMGGSSLAPEVLNDVFVGGLEDRNQEALKFQILDSTDPEQVRIAPNWYHLEKTLFIVSSKSGTTSEVAAFFQYFWELVRKQDPQNPGSQFIAITDPQTPLVQLAEEKGFRRIFPADPKVGGRYSALSAFGLVPAGLIGLDLNQLLEAARRMAIQCNDDVPSGRNPGLVLGAILGEAARHGRDKVTFLSDPEYAPVEAWLEQLIAESSGKQGKGILPVAGEPPGRPEQYGDDRLFVYLKGSGQLKDSAAELQKAGYPVLVFDIRQPYDLAGEFYRWEVATAMACAVLGVNAFDQPDVQDNKTRTEQKIAAYAGSGKFDEGTPMWEDPSAKVYGQPGQENRNAASLSALVLSFLARSKPSDYIAINAYLPRTPANSAALQELRNAIRLQTGLATTVGFGPRFLHSTGQLHKGGPETGIFLQITAEPEGDLLIPGGKMTFGILERAQALGDLEALLARRRRAIRVHLTGAQLSDLI
jgi:transaldolase/glucose-6-phosphate isomerase